MTCIFAMIRSHSVGRSKRQAVHRPSGIRRRLAEQFVEAGAEVIEVVLIEVLKRTAGRDNDGLAKPSL